ncbi:MAG: AAA family ATPase [Candidatus Omnitrophota bacterium]
MSYVIALAGKGGTGKTTVAALIVRTLREMKQGSLLAVDADPNSNLNEALGIPTHQTIGQVLDDISAHPEKIPAGIRKDAFIEYQIQTAIAEGSGFDVLTMGRPEGPGCYCYVNNVLRNIMSKLIKEYDFVVIDNEAGLEHLSRRTTRFADTLLVVADPTPVGLKAAQRIVGLVRELKIQTKKNLLILNRSDASLAEEKIKDLGLELIGTLPVDDQIERVSLNGHSLLDLTQDAKSLVAFRKLGDKIWQNP